ncbi:MAG TPA: four helix bundle protein [Brevefilum sp.]
MEGLNRLQVYQKAQELVKLVYKFVLPSLPIEEKYNLSSQIRRAAVSVPANIAEGFGRYYYQETIRFCYLARGSLMDLSSHIEVVSDQSYISYQDKTQIDKTLEDVLRLIQGYIKYLKKTKRGMNEPGAYAISELEQEYLSNDLEDL